MLNENYLFIKKSFSRLKEKFKKKKNTVAIIQVRMESTRLPGKAMFDLMGKSCLQHVIERVQQSKLIDSIVVATTNRKADDVITNFVRDTFDNIVVHRGDTNDVYGRVLEAAQIIKADVIVDITADCPLIDPNIIDEVIIRRAKGNNDYASNVIFRSYADGMDVQVYTRKLMEKGNNIVLNPKDRENAGYNFIRHVSSFKKCTMGAIITTGKYRWPELRLTLDTKDDYNLIKKIFKHFLEKKQNNFSYDEIIDFLLKNPKLVKKGNINK